MSLTHLLEDFNQVRFYSCSNGLVEMDMFFCFADLTSSIEQPVGQTWSKHGPSWAFLQAQGAIVVERV